MSEKQWKIKDMLSYAHQLYPLLEEGDDAYRKKIRRFLVEKGYVVPDATSGKYSFRLSENMAKYVIDVALRDYFEKNIDLAKRDEFFQKKDAELNGGGGEEEIDYEAEEREIKALEEEHEKFCESLWKKDFEFTPMTYKELENAKAPFIVEEYLIKYEIYLLKKNGYERENPLDPKNVEIMERVRRIIEDERKFAWQRYYDARKPLPLELRFLGLTYIMLKQLVEQSYYFDEEKYVEDLQKWYRSIRSDFLTDKYRDGFSKNDSRIKKSENYFTKK